MNEIKIYYDSEKTKEIIDTIDFGILNAGDIIRKTIYLYNILKYTISVTIIIEGEYIRLIDKIEQIKPNEIKSLTFEFFPNITTKEPIKANLKIKGYYIITG